MAKWMQALWGLFSAVFFFGAVSLPTSAASLADAVYDQWALDMAGFVEIRQGWRLQEDPDEQQTAISEARLQVQLEKDLDWGIFKFKGDLVGDGVEDALIGELRELYLDASPADSVDLRLGRQPLTWGTGDLLFINDLFPKDWKSFFIGRDDEYLKAPSDAVKISWFSSFGNLDIVYVPLFTGSNYIDGERLSYYNPLLGSIVGQNFIFDDHRPNRYFRDDEWALRYSRLLGSAEMAMYAYYGKWKTPEGLDPVAVRLTYPDLAAYGASLRGPLAGGIANAEVGYYDSLDDRAGSNPLIRNSELRLLVGFEREILRDLTGAVQYYLEWMADHNVYTQGLGGAPGKDEHRHVLTLRLTWLLLNQDLRLTFFGYYSPSDAHLRPKMRYQISDDWTAELGANIFIGRDEHTFFGQFENNTNAYAGLRWSF